MKQKGVCSREHKCTVVGMGEEEEGMMEAGEEYIMSPLCLAICCMKNIAFQSVYRSVLTRDA